MARALFRSGSPAPSQRPFFIYLFVFILFRIFPRGTVSVSGGLLPDTEKVQATDAPAARRARTTRFVSSPAQSRGVARSHPPAPASSDKYYPSFDSLDGAARDGHHLHQREVFFVNTRPLLPCSLSHLCGAPSLCPPCVFCSEGHPAYCLRLAE